MLYIFLAFGLAAVMIYFKVNIRDNREQRNIQIAVERALEEERKKQQNDDCIK